MVKVSVLVAVYNAEAYLRDCLDSLVGQTLREIQIICVDDASTDGSWDILQEYAQKDSRIEIVHLEENQGMSNARNTALQHAKGQYICMLDSDDWYSSDAMEKAYNVFCLHPQTDCVLFRFVLAYPAEGKFRYEDHASEKFDVMNGYEACIKSLTWKIHGIYMVRANIHFRYPYDATTRLNSDENTTRFHYFASREIRCCEGIYYYRQVSSSMSHAISLRRFDVIQANLNLKDFLVKSHAKEQDLAFFETISWERIVDCYMLYYKYRHLWNADERNTVKSVMRMGWEKMDYQIINKKSMLKLGFLPFHHLMFAKGIAWRLFCWEEEIYFFLKKITKRI